MAAGDKKIVIPSDAVLGAIGLAIPDGGANGGLALLVGSENPMPVSVLSDAATQSGTASTDSIASTATSTELLAANASRKGATITNTDANRLYVLLGAGTASAANHTVALDTDDYFEVQDRFTGEINGVWSGDGSGAALVTEF